jgi:uncharacterized coiled-coil protein SlyX
MPPPDELEKRVSTLERTSDRTADILDQINKTLAKFEQHIDELFEVKNTLESVRVMWLRIDEMTKANTAMDKAFAMLKAEHEKCLPVVSGVSSCKIDFDYQMKEIGTKVAALEKKEADAADVRSKITVDMVSRTIAGAVSIAAGIAIYLAQKGVFNP